MKMKYAINDKHKEYLRKVYRILGFKIQSSKSEFISIGYKVEMEFINRVLGDLFYTSEDRSRLNGLAKLIKEVG